MHRNLKAYFFLIPSLGLVLIFNYIPIAEAFFRSFYQWRGGKMSTFLGFQNYIEMFTDPAFMTSASNMLLLMLRHLVTVLYGTPPSSTG